MKDWKTTLTGIVGGIAVAILPLLQQGHFTLESLLTGAAIGLLGVLAKDFGSA